MSAADRFRDAVQRRDVGAMAETLAVDVRLRSPTLWAPVEGRERVRAIFGVLVELFEEFEYTRVLAGEALDAPEVVSTEAFVFRARVGTETLEGVDVFDIDADDRIAVLTVFIRPLAGLEALAAAIGARLADGPGPTG
jgi:hypothetical protein